MTNSRNEEKLIDYFLRNSEVTFANPIIDVIKELVCNLDRTVTVGFFEHDLGKNSMRIAENLYSSGDYRDDHGDDFVLFRDEIGDIANGVNNYQYFPMKTSTPIIVGIEKVENFKFENKYGSNSKPSDDAIIEAQGMIIYMFYTTLVHSNEPYQKNVFNVYDKLFGLSEKNDSKPTGSRWNRKMMTEDRIKRNIEDAVAFLSKRGIVATGGDADSNRKVFVSPEDDDTEEDEKDSSSSSSQKDDDTEEGEGGSSSSSEDEEGEEDSSSKGESGEGDSSPSSRGEDGKEDSSSSSKGEDDEEEEEEDDEGEHPQEGEGGDGGHSSESEESHSGDGEHSSESEESRSSNE